MNRSPDFEILAHLVLPGLATALSEIPILHHGQEDGCVGVVTFVVHPDAAFYRLSPESALRLREEITHRLNEQLRESDRLYGMNNWEWLIVLPGLRSSATLTMAMIRLCGLFGEHGLVVDGIVLHLSVSSGAAIYPDESEDALYVVQSARIAALHAERSASGSALYEPAMEGLDEHLKAFDRELRMAFAGDCSLQLYLQPQIEARSGRCLGAEALLRWCRANGEWVAPPVLLAAIERLGLRHRFNRWLFLAAAQSCHKLALAGIAIRVSINLSAHDLLDPEMPDLLMQALGTWNVAPAAIRLEITETSMVQDTESVIEVLLRLRELDVSLSIDDFGTGYSGMSNLKIVPVQEIKVDQSFILNLAESKRDQEITESIIRLAHRLGLQVVAEGVETPEAAQLLAKMGCEWLQGFLFSPAMPLEQFVFWCRERAVEMLRGAGDEGLQPPLN